MEPHPPITVFTCSCGYAASATTKRAAAEAFGDHLVAVHAMKLGSELL